MLTARRGLGIVEQQLIRPGFEAAVRWAQFAEQAAPRLQVVREISATDPPDDLRGAEMTAFQENRRLAREELAELEAALFPSDEVT